jgi:hypothetical protein
MEFSAPGGKLKVLAQQEPACRKRKDYCGDEPKVSARIIRGFLAGGERPKVFAQAKTYSLLL